MGYKVKRGTQATGPTIREMLLGFFRGLVVAVVILSVMAVICYFLFRFAYEKFPVFASAANDLTSIVKAFYLKHGLWTTLGVIGFICISIWAFGEELKRKERQKEAMKQLLK